MPAATRIGDTEVGQCSIGLPCCPHSRAGINTSGSPDIVINNRPSHRLTDEGNCRCPHGGTYTSIEGSPNVILNNLKQTRIGDKTKCKKCGKIGTHVSGSPDVIVN